MVQGHKSIVDNRSKLDEEKQARIKAGKAAVRETEKNYKNQLKEM